MTSVIRNDDGSLVGFGVGGADYSVPVEWTSTDGRTWTRVNHLSGEPQFPSVVRESHGFLALGEGIWWSEDGISWKKQSTPEDCAVWAVDNGPASYVAVGMPWPRSLNSRCLWTTADVGHGFR